MRDVSVISRGGQRARHAASALLVFCAITTLAAPARAWLGAGFNPPMWARTLWGYSIVGGVLLTALSLPAAIVATIITRRQRATRGPEHGRRLIRALFALPPLAITIMAITSAILYLTGRP